MNPANIRFSSRRETVEYLVLHKSRLKSLPEREFHWSILQQSRFVESILIRFPDNVFYIDTTTNPETVVDGFQRLQTLRAFLDDELILTSLEFMPQLNGWKFSTLPRNQARSLEEVRVVVHYIDLPTTLEERDYIVSRIRCP